MKKLIYAICMGAAVAFSSCEDMLDTTNYRRQPLHSRSRTTMPSK